MMTRSEGLLARTSFIVPYQHHIVPRLYFYILLSLSLYKCPIGSAIATAFCKSTEVHLHRPAATAPATAPPPHLLLVARRPHRPPIRSSESRRCPSSIWRCRLTTAGPMLPPVLRDILTARWAVQLKNSLFGFVLFVYEGTSGTRGRTCSREKGAGLPASQRRSCVHLCRNCGYKVKRRVTTVLTSCNCTFQW